VKEATIQQDGDKLVKQFTLRALPEAAPVSEPCPPYVTRSACVAAAPTRRHTQLSSHSSHTLRTAEWGGLHRLPVVWAIATIRPRVCSV
jgi:hypothetical protein